MRLSQRVSLLPAPLMSYEAFLPFEARYFTGFLALKQICRLNSLGWQQLESLPLAEASLAELHLLAKL